MPKMILLHIGRLLVVGKGLVFVTKRVDESKEPGRLCETVQGQQEVLRPDLPLVVALFLAEHVVSHSLDLLDVLVPDHRTNA